MRLILPWCSPATQNANDAFYLYNPASHLQWPVQILSNAVYTVDYRMHTRAAKAATINYRFTVASTPSVTDPYTN